jgi:MFS family permease
MQNNDRQYTFHDLISNKAFLILWINQFCLQLSYSLINFTFILWMYELTKKNTYVSLLLFTLALPSILFAMYAGVIADRVNRRKIIQITDAVLAILFFLFLLIGNNVWMIFLLAFIVSTVSQFFLPAEAATIPTIVPRELLIQANSLFSLTIYASLIVGYTLAGPIINITQSYTAPFVGAGIITAFASILFMYFPKIEQTVHKVGVARHVSQSFSHTWSEIQEGLRYIFHQRILISAILLLTSVQAFISTISVLIPEYIYKVLQIPATNASLIIMLPLGLGLITGAVFNGAYGKYLSRRKLVEVSIIGVSLMLLSFAFAPIISNFLAFQVLDMSTAFRRPLEHILGLSGLLAIFSYFLGFFNVSIVIPAQTLMQEHTSEEVRGRVFGVLNMLMYSLATVPMIVVGSLTDTFGTISILTFLSLAILCVGLILVSNRFVTEMLHFKR